MKPTWTRTPDALACDYCGATFRREDHLALHRGREHPGALSDAEQEAYEAARESEERRLRLYKYKALGALVLTYFGMVMVYALVT
jgi:hypothetical protein